jgi:hypothetical protein
MHRQYTWETVLAASERVNWRVEDLIGQQGAFDLARPFMPESLARVEGLGFLCMGERRTLNQIRAHGYLNVFGLVEEFILPFVLDHARLELHADDYRVRALLRFAAEEAKHIHLFRRFREAFTSSFATRCDVDGPAREIARNVLAHHPLAVALVILQTEWMTQQHYLESVRDDRAIEPRFASLLRHHWMEEAQHAKIDTLMVESLAASCAEGEIERALDDYERICTLLDEHLVRQVELDLDALQRATGRSLVGYESEAFRTTQRQAQRWTFLGSGMKHPRFLETIAALRPAARTRIEERTATFC